MSKVLSNHPRESGKTATASSSRSHKVPRSGRSEIAVGLVSSETDAPVNDALIAIAQEVAELLKESYPVRSDEADSIKLIAGNSSAE